MGFLGTVIEYTRRFEFLWLFWSLKREADLCPSWLVFSTTRLFLIFFSSNKAFCELRGSNFGFFRTMRLFPERQKFWTVCFQKLGFCFFFENFFGAVNLIFLTIVSILILKAFSFLNLERGADLGRSRVVFETCSFLAPWCSIDDFIFMLPFN